MLSRSPRGLFLGIYQDRGKIALGVALIFATLLLLAGLLSRGIARPIEALSEATQNVARGPVAVPEPPSTAAVEIRTLYLNFAAMADRIERRSRYLRDFAAAVSHELKTPIAGIKGALELLTEHPTMSDAERARFLANAGAAHPDRNYFGIELSKKYARLAAERVAKKRLANVRMLPGDARLFMAKHCPPASLAAVHVYFPDPWWKKRHRMSSSIARSPPNRCAQPVMSRNRPSSPSSATSGV